MTRYSQGFALALAAALVLVGACGRDGPVAPGPAVPDGPSLAIDPNPACDPGLGGVTHADSVKAPETWSRAGSPHRVNGEIAITGAGVLTLEPGVLVCFGTWGSLAASGGGRLVANGLDTARIVLTATDLAFGWVGVATRGTPASPSSMKHVRVEYTNHSYALETHDYHAVHVDSAVFRQNRFGLHLWGRGTILSRSRVDTVVDPGLPAVEIGTVVTFEANAIRGAPGVGLAVRGVHGVSLLGGRVEGSGGVGMLVTTTGAGFVATQPVRVVGGASYPARLVVSAFPRIWPALAHQDSLLGNARDTLVVEGGILQQFAYPTAALPWRVTEMITVQHYGILRPLPGATLTFDWFAWIYATNGGRVVARGTQAAPVLFTAADPELGWGGLAFDGAPSQSSFLTNVRIEHANSQAVAGHAQHRVVIDSAVLRQNGFGAWLYAPGSRISRSRIDTTLYANVAVLIAGDSSTVESVLIRGAAGAGLAIAAATAQVLSCEVRDGAGNGIEVLAGAEVHNCNLVNNAGYGIAGMGSFVVNAENNWWGDAAGPLGPNGDGVSGQVDYTPWRTTPFVLPYVP